MGRAREISKVFSTSTALSTDSETAASYLTTASAAALYAPVAAGGLVHINTTDISAVPALSLNNVFSSTYRNYRIVIDAEGSSQTDLVLRFRVGGVDAAGAGTYKRQVLDVSGTSVTGNRNSETYALLGGVATDDGASSWFIVDITQPFLANESSWVSTNIRNQSSTFLSVIGGYHDVTTSYDGFTLATVASTNMTGQVSVYGYRKS